MKKLFNLLLIISSILILSACAESGDSKNTKISDIGSITNVDKRGKYDLEISGIKNTVTIKSNNTIDNLDISGVKGIVTIKSNNTINNLKISGTKNAVYIEPNTSVSNFIVPGTENIIYVPLNSKISFTDSGVGNERKTRTTNSILGDWSYTYPATQCVVSYLFKTNGTFSGTSLVKKIFSGTYDFEKTVVTNTKHSLRITFSEDNGLPDCNGTNSNKKGKTEITYLNFSNNNTMQWYSTSTSGTAMATFLKDQD